MPAAIAVCGHGVGAGVGVAAGLAIATRRSGAAIAAGRRADVEPFLPAIAAAARLPAAEALWAAAAVVDGPC